jgi:nucleotide-binding universal stress UspA family protein
MSEVKRSVVVGVDGSDAAYGALVHGAWEADRRGCPLRLIYSYRVLPPLLTGVDLADVERKVGSGLLAACQIRVHEAFPGLNVEREVVSGSPGGALVAASSHAELVVVGSRGLGGFAGLLLGSVGIQLAAHSHAPVIVTRRPGYEGTFGAGPAEGPVVVGVDGIPESTTALGFAFDEAAARGVPLIATYAWWMLPPSNLGPTFPRAYDLVDAEDEARRMLAEAVAGWGQKYPDVHVTLYPVHSMNPAVGLLELSRTAGLLVVGRHGGNAVSRLLFASFGDIAVREADCPVAVVPEPST